MDPIRCVSELTDSVIASQAFVFFLAGFETSSTTMSHALYELAQNHKVQDRLREEIEQEYGRNGGTFTYDNVKQMDYLDKVFKGTGERNDDTKQAERNYDTNGCRNITKISAGDASDEKIYIELHFQRYRDQHTERANRMDTSLRDSTGSRYLSESGSVRSGEIQGGNCAK